MKKFLLLLTLAVAITACEKYDDTELRDEVASLHAQNNHQANEISDLKIQIQALTSLVNGEVNRLQALVDELDRRNLSLADNFQAVQAQLNAAIIQLEAADETNLAAALAAVADAEAALVEALESNIDTVNEALTALGVVDANLLSRIDALVVALDTLRADLSAEDINLQNAINDANTLIEAANDAIATNAADIAAIQTQLNTLEETVAAIDFIDETELAAALSDLRSALETAIAAGDTTVTASLTADLNVLADRVTIVEEFATTLASLGDRITALENAGFSTTASVTADLNALRTELQQYADGQDSTISTNLVNYVIEFRGEVSRLDDAIATLEGSVPSTVEETICDLLADSVAMNFILPELDGVVYLDTYNRTASGTRGDFVGTIGYVQRGQYLRLFNENGWFSTWGKNIREMDAKGGNPYVNFYVEGSTSTPTFVQPTTFAPVNSAETEYTLNFEFDPVTGDYEGCLSDVPGDNVVWHVNGDIVNGDKFANFNVGDLNGIYIITVKVTIDSVDHYVQHTVERTNSGRAGRVRGSVRVGGRVRH